MTLQDVLEQLNVKDAVMIYGVYQGDILNDYALDLPLKDLPSFAQVIIEKLIEPRTKIVHFDGNANRKHGIPFYIKSKEKYSEMKAELAKKLGNSQHKIYQMNAALLDTPLETIKDDDIVQIGNYIGVDHAEKRNVNKITFK